MVQGRTAPDPDEAHLLHGLARSVEIDAPEPPGTRPATSPIPRALLERLGGFDERFGRLGRGHRSRAARDRSRAPRSASSARRARPPRGRGARRSAARSASALAKWEGTTPARQPRAPDAPPLPVRRLFFNRTHADVSRRSPACGAPPATRSPPRRCSHRSSRAASTSPTSARAAWSASFCTCPPASCASSRWSRGSSAAPSATAPRWPEPMRIAFLHPTFWPEVRRGSERVIAELGSRAGRGAGTRSPC